jgi:hypothetical protein
VGRTQAIEKASKSPRPPQRTPPQRKPLNERHDWAMQVRLFSSVIQPGTNDDAFEREINDWLNEQNIEVLSMTVSTSERDSSISMVFFIVYDELEDDNPDDELPVTLPQITVEIPYDPLTPRFT